METETEKTSYNLINTAKKDEKEEKLENYEKLNGDETATGESDKMLNNEAIESHENEVNGEPEGESAALTGSKTADASIEAEKPKSSRNFLQYFQRNKSQPEKTEVDGAAAVTAAEKEPLDKSATSEAEKPKRFNIPLTLKNPFKKPTSPPPPPPSATENGNGDAAVPNEEQKKEKENGDATQTPSSKPLSSLLPQFTGLINRLRRSTKGEDIELGSRPKAGLASMETLDDSTKDPWNQDSPDGENKEEEAKKDTKIADTEAAAKGPTIVEQIRSFSCSIDDLALIAGFLLFLLLVALIFTFTFFGSAKQTLIAPIRDGKVLAATFCGLVEGLSEDSAVAFRGIPYAKPPLGKLRFEAAQVIDDIDFCWNDTFKAHNATPVCLQMVDGKDIGTENCLTLDIITPEVRYINLLPVVVLIGTNTFTGGSPGNLTPSARYSRSRDVIFVRPNFRMNAFGFLALESLSNSSNVPTSGNYALTDIIAALKWINLNINHFGGNPNSVTLFGHRSGATIVTALTASSEANQLFARAWVTSGSAHLPGKKLSESERSNVDYSSKFSNCLEKDCWQGKGAVELMTSIPEAWQKDLSSSLPSVDEEPSTIHDWIVRDGVILKHHPQDFWKADAKNAPKIVIGTTAHVAYDQTRPAFATNLTAEEIWNYVNESAIGKEGLTEQAIDKYGSDLKGLITMISDIRYVCPLLALARSQPNIPFFVVTQAEGELNLADVDSDVLAILGRYTTDTPEKRRFLQAIQTLFYYYVSHGKIESLNPQKLVLDIGQDVIPKENYPNCDFWIQKDFVPKYAATF